MTTEPFNPRPPDEAELLAWVEGEALPRDRELAVARALGEDRALAARLDAMRGDRAAVRALGEVGAPAGLLLGIEATLQPILERQMLLGLTEGEPVEDHPPVSIVRPVRKSIVAAFLADRAGRRLALAAGLLLMVGGATYVGTMYLSGRTTPLRAALDHKEKGPTLARAEQPAVAPPPPVSEAPVQPSTLADAGPKPADELPSVAPETTIASAAGENDGAAMGPFLPELDGARAADLARQGRLAIRIRAVDPTVTPGRVMDRVRHGNESMFRMGDDPSPAVVALLAPPAAPDPAPAREAPVRPALANDTSYQSDVPENVVGPPRPPPDWQPAPSVYLVQARLDQAAMDSLKALLSGSYGQAEFEELSDAIPEGRALPMNPASVVWWGQSPAGWAWWGNVPVVIDTAR